MKYTFRCTCREETVVFPDDFSEEEAREYYIDWITQHCQGSYEMALDEDSDQPDEPPEPGTTPTKEKTWLNEDTPF